MPDYVKFLSLLEVQSCLKITKCRALEIRYGSLKSFEYIKYAHTEKHVLKMFLKDVNTDLRTNPKIVTGKTV